MVFTDFQSCAQGRTGFQGFPKTMVDVSEEHFYDPWRLRGSPGGWPEDPSSILGAQRSPQKSLLELWVAFGTSSDALPSISKTLNKYFYCVFNIMKLHLGLLGYALWEKERLNAFTRS